MTDNLFNVDQLIEFLDKKISRLRRQLEISRSTEAASKDVQEIENEISIWKAKRVELTDLQVKFLDEQIKELTA